jgi:hypothetical protein
MHKYICLLLLSVAFFSCEETALKYTQLHFPKTVSLQGEVCNDAFLFNSPKSVFVEDSLLIVYDSNSDGIIHIFNKAGLHKRSAIKRGRGSGEVVTPGSIDIIDSKVLICDLNLKHLIVYDLYKILINHIPYHTDVYPLANNLDWIVQAKWYKIDSIAVKSYSEKMRYGFLHGGKTISTYWEYPSLVSDQEENRSIWDYFSQWKFKPDYSKMVTTTYIGSLMEILNSGSITNIKTEKLIPIHKPQYNLAEGARPKWVTSSDDTVVGFEDLFVTDSSIYALIYGVNINALEASLPSIYVFSWDGEPKVKYQFEERILTFGVDEQEGVIYAIASDDTNLSLRKYKM